MDLDVKDGVWGQSRHLYEAEIRAPGKLMSSSSVAIIILSSHLSDQVYDIIEYSMTFDWYSPIPVLVDTAASHPMKTYF
jgi:hypothetical protein